MLDIGNAVSCNRSYTILLCFILITQPTAAIDCGISCFSSHKNLFRRLMMLAGILSRTESYGPRASSNRGSHWRTPKETTMLEHQDHSSFEINSIGCLSLVWSAGVGDVLLYVGTNHLQQGMPESVNSITMETLAEEANHERPSVAFARRLSGLELLFQHIWLSMSNMPIVLYLTML